MIYNKFGEVISVNGIVTGQHLGSPMQDAIAEKPEDNQAYAIARNTQTTLPNSQGTWENQPKRSGGGETVDAMIDKSITEVTSDASTIRDYCFYTCTNLYKADIPNATKIGKYAFKACKALTAADFPLLESLGTYAFEECTSLLTVNLPNVTSVSGYCFNECTKLTTVNLGTVASMGSRVFYGCSKLNTLIIRNTEQVCTLENWNSFTSTAISGSNGYIYVPSALIEDYKVETNWSRFASRFRALEDYTVDGTVTGELDSTKI